MKIKIIGVNPTAHEHIREITKAGEDYFNSIKEPGTEIDFVWPTKGPILMDQQYWESLALTYTLQSINDVDENVYDGVIIWCGLDPGLTAAKERLNIPVVGCLQSALALAYNLGRRVGIITIRSTASDMPTVRGPNAIVHDYIDKIRAYGMDKLVVSIRDTGLTVLQCCPNEEQEANLRVARQLVEQDGADVLILGAG